MAGLLEMFGLNPNEYDEPKNPAEIESFKKLVEARRSAGITLDSFKKFVVQVRKGIDAEVCKPEISDRLRDHLLARLENMIVMEAFFDNSETSLKTIQDSIDRLKHEYQKT